MRHSRARARGDPSVGASPLNCRGINFAQIPNAFDPLHIEAFLWNRKMSAMAIRQSRLDCWLADLEPDFSAIRNVGNLPMQIPEE